MLKVGIIGYGIIGKRRRLYIDQNPHFKTYCVSDITLPQNGKFEDGIKCFSDYKLLLKQDIDVVFISVPNNISAVATVLALENGMHVFCEKPPGRNVGEIKNVIECYYKTPELKLKYGFNHRYHESVKKAKSIVDTGEFGPVVSFRGVYGKSSIVPFGTGWRSKRELAGGGILLDQGIHMLDLIRYFSGDYDEIFSCISNDYWKHDVEDNAFVLMRNENGQIASLHSTATQWQHKFSLDIILKEGLISLSGILSGSKSYGSETLKIINRKDKNKDGNHEETKFTYLEDNSWKEEIDEFADSIVNGKKIQNGTPEEALAVMNLIELIYKADKKWKYGR